MPTAISLLECQRQLIAALYAPGEPGPIAAIVGNGLEPAARLRVYRNSCEAIQTGALRTAYPAVLALVGEAFFDHCAHGYRCVHASRTGNLQDFGAAFASYLAALPGARTLTYLADVARLEWLRQQTALAADAAALPVEALECTQTAHITLKLHPSVRRFTSPHAVLTIFRYAMQPDGARLQLPDAGENVLLWREDGEIAMAALDAASFACIDALACGQSPADAHAIAAGIDPAFDLSACVASLVRRGLVVAAARGPSMVHAP